LPEIWGQLNNTAWVGDSYCKGAFTRVGINNDLAIGTSTHAGALDVDFHASTVNNIYGSSNTVTPASIKVGMYISY